MAQRGQELLEATQFIMAQLGGDLGLLAIRTALFLLCDSQSP